MSSLTVERLLQEAETLPLDERISLINRLKEGLNRGVTPNRTWRDLIGLMPNLSLGEDAQQWVTRTRREADEAREIGRVGDDDGR